MTPLVRYDARADSDDRWAAAAALEPHLAFVAYTDGPQPVRPCVDTLDCYELDYVLQGRLDVWLGEAHLPAAAGDLVIIPPGTLHAEATPPGVASQIIFLGATFRNAAGRTQRYPQALAPSLHLGCGHPVEQRLRQIIAEVHERPPGHEAIVRSAIGEIFCHLARASAGLAVPEADLHAASLQRFGAQAQAYLREHLAEPLSLDDMARQFHLSRQYFGKLFRRATGQTPHAHLTELRVRRAAELLRDPTLSVKQVAARCGFDDPYYFSKVFKLQTGQTPSQARRG